MFATAPCKHPRGPAVGDVEHERVGIIDRVRDVAGCEGCAVLSPDHEELVGCDTTQARAHDARVRESVARRR
jgi:hypothetical protein